MPDESQNTRLGVERHETGPLRDAPAEQVPERHTLGDMARDGYVFFSYALILTHGHFNRDPLVEWLSNRPGLDKDLHPHTIICKRPVFQGLPSTRINGQLRHWNHEISCIRKESWEDCRDFIGSIAILDREKKFYARLLMHELKIVDPVAMASKILTEIPTLDIFVFCVSSTTSFTWLKPAVDPPRTFAYPIQQLPRPDVLAEAEAVLGPPPDPQRLTDYLEQKRGQDDHRPPQGN